MQKYLGERMYKWGSNVRSSETLKWYEKAGNGMKMLRFVLPFIQHVRFSGEEGLKKGLNRYFKDDKITSVFQYRTGFALVFNPYWLGLFWRFSEPSGRWRTSLSGMAFACC
jgi:hypothetical protein